MKYKRINIPIYNQVLHIIISEDVESEIKDINKKFYCEFDNYDFAGYAIGINKHNLLLINNKNIPTEAFKISVISHESFHISNFISKRIGINPDVNNDEPQAYLLSWIVEETIKFMTNEK